jgi:transcription elongation GreA/GreB family factor
MKAKILASILSQLETELQIVEKASQAAHEAATSEESKPENQYDTRALEASYLAEAQAKRAFELKKMIQALRSFPKDTKSKQIETGSLVNLKCEEKEIWYILSPFGAGVTTEETGIKVTVVTLESPLGKTLFGKKAGDSFEFRHQGAVREYEILLVN